MARTIWLRRSALVIAVLLATGLPALADVTVEGTTYELKNGKYLPLGGVQIQAYRDNAPLLVKASVSLDKDGRFSFKVKEGEPFDVLFYGNEIVPEITMIAALPNGKNFVQIALYSKDQYQKSARVKHVPLAEKVACLLKHLPTDDPATSAIRKKFM